MTEKRPYDIRQNQCKFLSLGSPDMSDKDMETNEADVVEDTVGAEDIFGDDLSIRYLVLTCDNLSSIWP